MMKLWKFVHVSSKYTLKGVLLSLTKMAGQISCVFIIPCLSKACSGYDIIYLYSRIHALLCVSGMILTMLLISSLWLKDWGLPFSSTSKSISGVHPSDKGSKVHRFRLTVHIHMHYTDELLPHGWFTIFWLGNGDIVKIIMNNEQSPLTRT